MKIDGLRAGLYHYVPDVHVLELLNSEVDRDRIPAYLPGNEYWSDACALVLFSAVYEREIWRYEYSRAYRAPLVEAGHLCQTFCLLATAHDLAPFCAMAFSDSAVESDLRIDGVSESALYTAGIGIRPPDAKWAMAPDGIEDPVTTRNPYLQPGT